MKQRALLASGLSALNISFTEAHLTRLLAYLQLLYKWNKTYNLTSVGVPGKGISQEEVALDAVRHHLLDSLSILPFLKGETMLDVGSGSGTPGIPVAIVKPELTVGLIDSNAKKCAFLRQATIELGLNRVSVHEGRVEQYHPEYGFSMIVSRAFASLEVFTACSMHLLDKNGRWLAMKGLCPSGEIEALPETVEIKAVHRLSVPYLEGERHLVEMAMRQEAGPEYTGGES